MLIRSLGPGDDRLALSRIYEESWRREYSGIVPQEYLDAIPTGRWAPFFDAPGIHTLVALDGDSYAGTASFAASRFPQYRGAGEVISLYLLPEYAGRGYGRALLGTALDGLAALGYDGAFLWVLEGNTHARCFYEKAGFTLTADVLEDEIGGRRLREVRYTIELRK